MRRRFTFENKFDKDIIEIENMEHTYLEGKFRAETMQLPMTCNECGVTRAEYELVKEEFHCPIKRKWRINKEKR